MLTSVTSVGATAAYGYSANGEPTSSASGRRLATAGPTTTISASPPPKSTVRAHRQGTERGRSITAGTNLGLSPATTPTGGGERRDHEGHSTFWIGDKLLVKWRRLALECGDELDGVRVGSVNGMNFTYTANGERSTATPYTSGTAGAATYYDWTRTANCAMSPRVPLPALLPPPAAPAISTKAMGCGQRRRRLRPLPTPPGTELRVERFHSRYNHAITSGSATTNVNGIYGDLLFGGTAPIEQITTTSTGATAVFLVANQTGVQGVYSHRGN